MHDAPQTQKIETLDTPAAAAYLGLAPATLEIWRSTGRYDLPFMKIGRSVRYRRSDLDQFQRRRTFTQTNKAVE